MKEQYPPSQQGEIKKDEDMMIEEQKNQSQERETKFLEDKVKKMWSKWGETKITEFSHDDEGSPYQDVRAAEAYEKLGEVEKAREIWKKHAGEMVSRGHKSDYESAAIAYEKLGEEEKARELWRKEAEEAERIHHNYDSAAIIYEKLGEEEKAREMWKEYAENGEKLTVGMKWSLSDAAKHSESCRLTAEAYEKAGEKEKATEAWIEYADAPFVGFITSAKIYKRLGKKREFTKKFLLSEKAVEYRRREEDENYISDYNELFEKSDEEETYNKILKKKAEEEKEDNNYKPAAEIYEELGEEENAKEMWKKYVEVEKNIGYFPDSVAKAYEKLGEVEKAREMWFRYAKHLTEDSRFYHLDCDNIFSAAKIYEELGEEKNAKEACERLAEESEKHRYFKFAAEAYEEVLRLSKKTK